jgi:Vacuolar protein sorting-associated protein 62
VRLRHVLGAVVLTLVLAPAGSAGQAPAVQAPELLRRHAPIVVLHPSERFAPVPVEGFLADSDLQRRTTSGWETVEESLPAGGSDTRLDQRLCSARDGTAATACYAAAQAAHRAGPVVYGAARRSGDRIDLQYWLWYPFNPYSAAPGLWQVHEGDWEAVSVIVDLAGQPLHVGYSQHSRGERRDWAAAPKRGSRPLVHVALGSHANYPDLGIQRFDPRVVGNVFISIIRQNGGRPIDRTGRGRVVRAALVPVNRNDPSWMRYAGRWGEDEYLRVPGGQPVASGGGGPRGPAFHAQWRRAVREVLSWPRG